MNNIFLTGFMGCGKSTVGRPLAKLIGFELIDLDALIVEQQGRSIPEIFAFDGEAAFRDCETAALRSLEGRTGLVVSTGGGIVGREENWAIMNRLGAVIYLRARWQTLRQRLQNSSDRPLAQPEKGWNSVRTLWESRLPLYGRAPYVVDVDRGSPRMIAQKVISLLEQE